MSPILEVRDLVAGYGRVNILHGVSLDVAAGEIVSVIGPNGAGKSTLMKAVFGLVRPDAGSIRLEGREIAGERPEALVRLGMSYVPQERNVFPSLSVEENLRMGAFARPEAFAGRRDAVFTLFPFLAGARSTRAGLLSGGERQMVAIGRALMSDPRLLLLDEPSAGLAPRLVGEVFAHVLEVNRAGVAVLMIEQNVRRALEASHRAYVLAMGRNVLDDTGPGLLANEQIGKLYLGE